MQSGIYPQTIYLLFIIRKKKLSKSLKQITIPTDKIKGTIKCGELNKLKSKYKK